MNQGGGFKRRTYDHNSPGRRAGERGKYLYSLLEDDEGFRKLEFIVLWKIRDQRF